MNRILNKKESQELVIKILGTLDSLVRTTYGPNGLNVLISNQYQQVYTKDGLAVISALSSEDSIENNILQEFIAIIKQINDSNLDGSTTASIITYALLTHFAGEFNYPPQRMKEAILREIETIKEKIDSLSKEASKQDKKEALDIVLNNNSSIAKLIPEAGEAMTYEVVEGEEDKLEEFKGFKNNTTFSLEEDSFNGEVLYIREFSSYQNLYLDIKNYLNGRTNSNILLLFKRLPSDARALEVFLKQMEKTLPNRYYLAGSLLPPKEAKEEKEYNYITHTKSGDIILTKNCFYLGESTHYVITLSSLNEAEFKQKKDAIDDAFSILKMKNYVVGGGYVFYLLSKWYSSRKAKSDLEKTLYELISKALLAPIKALVERSEIEENILIDLYDSNFIYNFANKQREKITKTKVKESSESLKRMFEISFKYVSNFITIGSIIQQ